MPSLPHRASVTPHALASTYDLTCARLDSVRFASALWGRQLDLWSADAATQRLIANRLGWLRAIDFVTPSIPRLRAFAQSIVRDGFTDVVLLGMGGSSLAPEVLRQVLGDDERVPRFRVLDSIDPEAVRAAMARAKDTLFVLASKSGSTIEPNAMAGEARRRVTAEGHTNWGSRFVAITDENTSLHRRAASDGFRDVFINPSDIGGRYSALSFFGMVPAALMGLDIDALLASARRMEGACRVERASENPGLALGALLAAGALSGRDKVSLQLAPPLESFGLWAEQLIAESTGKRGKGIVPIAGEGASAALSADRVVVALSAGGSSPDDLERLEGGDAPIAAIDVPGVEALGAEFLRWEIATAAAGWLLDINPFDEPNVQQAKDATRVLLDSYAQTKRLPVPEPHASMDGVRLTLTSPAMDHLLGRPAHSFLQVLQPGDYVGVLAYVPPDDPAWGTALESFRTAIASRTRCATTLGFGPRYLHSTGQLHKGGRNNGVFLMMTAEPDGDLEVPGEPYSFGVLESAQALGDFQSLDRTGRRALLIQLPRRDVKLVQQVSDVLLGGEGD